MSVQYTVQDLNSQSSDYESSPLTTGPGLPPTKESHNAMQRTKQQQNC